MKDLLRLEVLNAADHAQSASNPPPPALAGRAE